MQKCKCGSLENVTLYRKVLNRKKDNYYYYYVCNNCRKNLNKKYARDSAYVSKRVKAWRAKNPKRVKAQRAVFVAKRAGKIKQKPCEICGNKKAEAHHKDYNKPLDINWLCKLHHGAADVKRRK